MLKNYIKIAWRNIRKNKLYSFVNIIGLTTGIVSCLLIGVYVWNELTYDNFHENRDRIARVTMEYQFSGSNNKVAVTGTKVGPDFKRNFPQIESYVRTMKYPRVVSNGLQSFEEKQVVYADEDFFKVFSFPVLQGNGATALNTPNKIVLSETAAKKYFGHDNPIGKTLTLDGGDRAYEITAVVKDAPLNSQIQYDILVSFTSLGAASTETWKNANYITYLLLHDGKELNNLASQITTYMKKVGQAEMGISENSSDFWTYHLEPLRSVHLHSTLAGLEVNGNMTYIYVLSIVAILILLVACVNYVNLATAQSVSRSTEIGVRKVMGAGKSQLWGQFLGESFVITFLATALALAISISVLPLFNVLTGKVFTAAVFMRPQSLIVVVLLAILISIIAGAYPAFVLTGTKLVNILKSGIRVSHSGGMLRKSLITFQFVIAIFLVAATLIVTQQLAYIQKKDMGYDREQVVVLPVDSKTKPAYEQLKAAFQNVPNVISITGSYEDPTSIGWGDGISVDDGNGVKELSVNATPVDLNYLQTMGMQLVAGRDFTKADFALQDTSDNYKNYRSTFMLNETAVKDLGWTPEQAIGKTVSRYGPGTVVGVVKDFHFESLHAPIGPLLIFLDTNTVQQLFIKINTQNTAQTLAALESVWKSRIAHRSFDYHFMDEDFNALYKTEERIANLFSLFAGIAIVLACLGLFALAAFTTVQRTKEIGIRKVLGAGVGDIVALISKQFLAWVGIAILIATPLAWLAGNSWLKDFAYRIDIQWWIFALAGTIAALIALATVSFHAIKAARANPVDSLRDE
ncbi:ABC transporter permease [Olivibacter sitiensis]|uniref:ABC transporter permease n=1 Tax=Olivibacter sitiensis TaxID=376470 RepID=UPI00042072A4|nr:ABC transporter permease [Olivibacter sitiensis]